MSLLAFERHFSPPFEFFPFFPLKDELIVGVWTLWWMRRDGAS